MHPRYPRFDRSRLRLRPLSEREHLLDLSIMLDPDAPEAPPFHDKRIEELAERILEARREGAPVLIMMGAHVIRAGVAPLLIRLMEEKILTHIAMNGAGPIHDFEFALIGQTTESVGRYIREGQFGLWEETGRINRIVSDAPDLGLGESLGRSIQERDYPHKRYSLLAAGYRLSVPVTVHVGIGYDIIHEHPDCDGAVLGRASYEDFLIFAETVRHLEGGVVLSFGTAVMGPEVFLKALAMARNVAHAEGKSIRRFTTAVFDLIDLGEVETEPSPAQTRYYFRPLKTLLVRTVSDGGRSFYVCGAHRETIPALFKALQDRSFREGS